MQFTCVHAIQYSLNSCLLLLPCRSEGAPCVDWLCANVKTTVESVFVVHAVLSALLQVEHSDPILFHSFFLACEKRNKRNIRCDCSSAPQSYHLQYPHFIALNWFLGGFSLYKMAGTRVPFYKPHF